MNDNIPVFDEAVVRFAFDRIRETGLTPTELICGLLGDRTVQKISDQINQFLGNVYNRIDIEERLWIIIYTMAIVN